MFHFSFFVVALGVGHEMSGQELSGPNFVLALSLWAISLNAAIAIAFSKL